MTEMERILLEENRRLRNLLERVKMSRRKLFHTGHIRPVRDTQNTSKGKAWRLPTCEGSRVVTEGDAQSPEGGALAGPSAPSRPGRTALQLAGSRKAHTGGVPAGGTVH